MRSSRGEGLSFSLLGGGRQLKRGRGDGVALIFEGEESAFQVSRF